MVLCQGKIFLRVFHHIGHHILTQVSRFLQVKEGAMLKTQTRCSASAVNGHCEKSLVLWDEMAEPASETVKVISFFFLLLSFFFLKKPCLFCKNSMLGRTYCNLTVTKSFIKMKCLNIDRVL